MTPIHPVTILSQPTTRRHLALTMLLGISIGAAGVVGAMQYVEPAQTEAERILESACRLGPEIGAYAWQHRKPEGVECGRYK